MSDTRNEILEQILSAVSSGGDPSLKAQVDTNTANITGLAFDVIALSTSYVTGSVTQWSSDTWGVNPVPISNGSDSLLLGLVDNVNDKNAAVTDQFDELNIVPHQSKPIDVIKTVYRGQRTTHQIRVTMNITAGNDQHYEVHIRRGSDDSIVASYPVSRNPDSPVVTVDLLTFTYKSDDPYVTDGFYLAFVNDSGLTAELSGAYSITVFNGYQFITDVS